MRAFVLAHFGDFFATRSFEIGKVVHCKSAYLLEITLINSCRMDMK